MSTMDESPVTPKSARNPHASASRWRHQESSSYAQYAAAQLHGQGKAREPQNTSNTEDLADFLNKARIEPEGDENHEVGKHKPITATANDGVGNPITDGVSHNPTIENDKQSGAPDGREIVCGPLLNYRRMESGRWYGSVLVVVRGGGKIPLNQPSLSLRPAGQSQISNQGGPGDSIDSHRADGSIDETRVESECLYSDPRNTFWVFPINVPIQATESAWEYSLPDNRFSSEHKPRVNTFLVPAAAESMRIMFHSCNGFSVGTDEEAWSGPALWNDVVRKHSELPFHVMLGGGDQIYNDGIRIDGPLRPWTDIANPKKRRHYPFPEKLRAECDDYYLNNYIKWYNTAPFSSVNGQIPQVNIWDDHDVSASGEQGATITNQGLDYRWFWIIYRRVHAL